MFVGKIARKEQEAHTLLKPSVWNTYLKIHNYCLSLIQILQNSMDIESASIMFHSRDNISMWYYTFRGL